MTDFEQLYKQYHKDVYLYVKALSEEESIVEDITAETFVRAITQIEKFRGDCDIRVWLCQIAKNLYFSHLRKQKRQIPMPEEVELRDDRISIEQSFEDKETAERIHHYLHNMKEPYKEVFTLRVFCELSYAQIGKLFGKNESWARVTCLRAKRQIQKWMEVE